MGPVAGTFMAVSNTSPLQRQVAAPPLTDHLDLVPLARTVVLQVLVRPGQGIIAALELVPRMKIPLSAFGVARNSRRSTKSFGNSERGDLLDRGPPAASSRPADHF